jgi:DNA-binding HxlR family transcriptional regulator
MRVVEALLPLLALLVTVAVGYLISLLRVQAEKVKNETARASLLAAIAEAERVAVDAVQATNQMLVDRLKEASEDGKLTKEEAAEAMRMAVEYLQSHLTPGALQILQAAYGPIEEWIESYLEAKLAQQKYPYVEVHALANPQ